jgi:hypothetical protein
MEVAQQDREINNEVLPTIGIYLASASADLPFEASSSWYLPRRR